MERATYERAIAISERIDDLKLVLKEIEPTKENRLSYVDKDNRGRYQSYLARIGNILDKHDLLIREEIKAEIKALYAEIDSL